MKKITAGFKAHKARQDRTKYDPLEVGYALCDDVVNQLRICAMRHEKIFDEDEYFLGLFVASDPLIAGLRRHKYAAFLHMPLPRPNQSIYIYNKKTQVIKRLWTLPNALVMAQISSMGYIAPQWQKTKGWCDAFFYGWAQSSPENWINTTPSHFFNFIRKQHNISHLAEHEFLDANREELINSGCKIPQSNISEPFDFSKVFTEKVADS